MAALGAVGQGQAPIATELTLVTSDGWVDPVGGTRQRARAEHVR